MLSFLRRKDRPRATAPAVAIDAGRVFVNLRPDDRRRIARYIKVVVHARQALLNPRKSGIHDDKHMAQVLADLGYATGTLKVNGIDVPTDPVLAQALLDRFLEA